MVAISIFPGVDTVSLRLNRAHRHRPASARRGKHAKRLIGSGAANAGAPLARSIRTALRLPEAVRHYTRFRRRDVRGKDTAFRAARAPANSPPPCRANSEGGMGNVLKIKAVSVRRLSVRLSAQAR
jgi:hypothetical protein